MQISNGLEVRFEYDDTKLQPSNISTNSIVNDVTAINDYFRFVDDFAGTPERPVLEISSDINEVGNGNNVVRAEISLYPPLSTIPESEHIKEKDGSKVITTGEKAKLGEMSFRMITDNDPFDITGFKLKTSEKYSPTTGIKINLDTIHCYVKSDPKTGVFRFADETASKDADLTNLVVSSGQTNQENPDESTYKEYTLDPIFNKETNNYTVILLEYLDAIDITATQSDAKSTMKIKVPKRDSDGNLVYDSDGTTIIYEEKDISNAVPSEITLNKLGEPETEITIKVTAEDGVTKNTYKLVIKRPYATIKGKAILADFDNPVVSQNFLNTYGTTLNHKVKVNVYKADLARWEEIPDIYQTTYENPFNYEDLAKISKETTIESKEDGTFEIYIIPGKYDVQIERPGFLDYIYANVKVNEGEIINMNEIRLKAGDTNGDGVITGEDISLTKKVIDLESSDPSFKDDYNPTQTGTVIGEDLVYVKTNQDQELEIVYFK